MRTHYDQHDERPPHYDPDEVLAVGDVDKDGRCAHQDDASTCEYQCGRSCVADPMAPIHGWLEQRGFNILPDDSPALTDAELLISTLAPWQWHYADEPPREIPWDEPPLTLEDLI